MLESTPIVQNGLNVSNGFIYYFGLNVGNGFIYFSTCNSAAKVVEWTIVGGLKKITKEFVLSSG